MANLITVTIGPPGDPTTSYSYDTVTGRVTLAPRPATQRTPVQVRGIVSTIGVFVSLVMLNETPLRTTPIEPYVFRQTVDTPGVLTARFRCDADAGNLVVDATIDLISKLTNFAERPEKTIAWSDFERFVKWMGAIEREASQL